jgi:hypothetical protein
MVFILVLSADRAAVVIVVIQQVAADLGPGEGVGSDAKHS